MQVTPHVHALYIPFQIRAGPGVTIDRFVFAYLITGRRVCLVDTGVASSGQVIFDYLSHLGRRPDEVALVVQTHAHPDHIGATRTIQQATGCAVAAHSGDQAWIEDVERQTRERPVPGFHDLVAGSVTVDRVLTDGDALDAGGLTLRVIHTPGHSSGSVSLWLEEDGVLFAGDAIPLPTDAPIYDDVPATVSSIRRLRDVSGVRVLLQSWDIPREGERAYAAMDEGLRTVQRVHEAVLRAAAGAELSDPADVSAISRRVADELGLPPSSVNPLFVRSVQAHLRAGRNPL